MIDVRFEAGALARKMEFSAKQTQKLIAVTLTQAAYNVQKGWQDEMRRVFDRPTPYVLHSVYVKQAKIQGAAVTSAVIGIRGSKRGTVSPSHVLYAEIAGGMRSKKGSESMFSRMRLGNHSVLGYWTPGSGADLDQYGNMPGTRVKQILSAMQLFETQGSAPAQGNAGIRGTTGLSRSQVARIRSLRANRQTGEEDLATREIARIRAQKALGNAKTQISNYFVASNNPSKAPTIFSFDWQQSPGKRRPNNPQPAPVWRKTNIKPQLVFTKKPTYKPRLPVLDIAKRIAAQDMRAIIYAQASRLFVKWNTPKA
jgi:hypothetical protein